MARPRSAGFDTQRHDILHRAATLFAHRGYAGTSMHDVAAECGLGKATLYHYVRDKQGLLAQIAAGHVARLEAVAAEVISAGLPPAETLGRLIERFVDVYAGARHEHRVLTEDVKFLDASAREQVLAAQRRVVQAFAEQVALLRPDLAAAQVHRAVTMLLFGMLNWTFTWLRPDGVLNHEALGRMVAELFFGGLCAVSSPAGAVALRARRRGG